MRWLRESGLYADCLPVGVYRNSFQVLCLYCRMNKRIKLVSFTFSHLVIQSHIKQRRLGNAILFGVILIQSKFEGLPQYKIETGRTFSVTDYLILERLTDSRADNECRTYNLYWC